VSPLRGEKPQNRPLSKFNTGRFALRAMLPVTIMHNNDGNDNDTDCYNRDSFSFCSDWMDKAAVTVATRILV